MGLVWVNGWATVLHRLCSTRHLKLSGGANISTGHFLPLSFLLLSLSTLNTFHSDNKVALSHPLRFIASIHILFKSSTSCLRLSLSPKIPAGGQTLNSVCLPVRRAQRDSRHDDFHFDFREAFSGNKTPTLVFNLNINDLTACTHTALACLIRPLRIPRRRFSTRDHSTTRDSILIYSLHMR